MDEKTTISDLKALVEGFVDQRDWAQFHSPKNLSMALAVEASELMELFKWHTEIESVEAMKQSSTKDAAVEEMADVVIYCVAFANRNGIDIAQAVKRKVASNRQKDRESLPRLKAFREYWLRKQ